LLLFVRNVFKVIYHLFNTGFWPNCVTLSAFKADRAGYTLFKVVDFKFVALDAARLLASH
jgi:hypothetical protein